MKQRSFFFSPNQSCWGKPDKFDLIKIFTSLHGKNIIKKVEFFFKKEAKPETSDKYFIIHATHKSTFLICKKHLQFNKKELQQQSV